MICGILPIIAIFSGFLVAFFLNQLGGRIYIYVIGSFIIIAHIAIHGCLDYVEK